MSYATASDVKALSPLPEVQSASNEKLTSLIGRAELIVNNFCKQNFNDSGEKTVFQNGSGSMRLSLKERLHSLTQLRFLELDDGGAKILSSEIVKDVYVKDWYLLMGEERIGPTRIGREENLNFGLIFPLGRNNIEITGKFGYASVPEEVKNATALIVERLVANEGDIKAKAGVFRSEKIGDYSYQKFDPAMTSAFMREVPDEAKILLSGFKRPLRIRRI